MSFSLYRKKDKKEGWYRKRNYPHFDSPLTFEIAKSYVTDPIQVTGHQFFPLLSYNSKSRRYLGHNDRRTKVRPIKYAAHLDGYIYSYYCFLLSDFYEERIKTLGLDKYILAYRRGKGLSNIDFAHHAFEEIRKRGKCVAIAMDISGFFDNIDHNVLEDEWCKTLNVLKLPKDHLAVFRSVTRWAEVDKDDCYNRLNIEDAKLFFGKSLCSNAREFRDKVKGRVTGQESLIKINRNNYGVPQGTPISALLSNMYMVKFDETMRDLALKFDGYYRRYSDDIIWICDQQYARQVLDAVDVALTEQGAQLKRKDEKTEKSIFNLIDGQQISDRPLQYLGFIFDGRKALFRSQTLARYWRRMIYATRAAKRGAKEAEKSGKSSKVFRKKLYRELTHLGKRNFVSSYAYRAQEIMGGKGIRRQLAGHQERIDQELNKL